MASEGNKSSLNLEQLTRGLSPEDTLRLLQQGKFRPGKRYSPEQAQSFLNALAPVMRDASPEDAPYHLPAEGEGAYLLRIFNPGANMFYVTLVVNGVPLFTRNSEGDLDQSSLYESEDPLLRRIVEAGMPEDVQAFFKRKSVPGAGDGDDKKKKRKKTHRVRDKPSFVFDPQIESFLKQCGEALVFEALENISFGEVKETVSGQDLENLLDAQLLRKVRSQGFQVTVQSLTNYVACSRKRIRDLRRIYVSDFLATEDITRLVSKYLREFRGKLPELINRSRNEELVFEDGKEMYFWFAKEDQKITVQHAVDGLRATLFRLYGDKLGKDEYLRFREASAKWLAYAKAADYVKREEFIQEKIVPLFREAAETEEERKAARNVNFEVMSILGRRIIEDEQQALPLYLRMTVRGLWMFDYFERDVGAEKNPMRTARGVDTEYILPLVHYLDRRNAYEPLLFAAAERLQREGHLLGEGVDTAAGCEALGRKLYVTVPKKTREEVFTDRRKGYEGRPLVADGTHLGRILRTHVGIHRERYQQYQQSREARKSARR